MVVLSFPLGEVIQSRDTTRRITKWALEMMGEGIMYAPQNAIKSLVLADFLVEWTKIQTPPTLVDLQYWTMYLVCLHFPASSLCFPHRVCMKYMVCLHFPASNNVAEYETLINRLHIAIELGIR
jgi:hypothetical protein